jgi:tRNA G26 N,N-dimethylase Trm1
MSKSLDTNPLSVLRIRRNMRIEIIYNIDNSINRVIAHRWQATQAAGVDIDPPYYCGATTFLQAVIPAAVQAQLLALSALIDSTDTQPVNL